MPSRNSPVTFSAVAGRLAASPWFSYVTLVLLQIKVTWHMWHYRDLTSGDTSSYFINASQWFHSGLTPIAWSPLYIAFYGSLLRLSSDAFIVTTLHRWLIVVFLAVLVLALMRRLLPADLAWFMAAWWVILPINFDALYEVHLFAVIPVMCAAIVILGRPSPWRRGAALAILLAASLLMRNELLLASGLLAAALIGATIWKLRHAPNRSRLNAGLALAYVIPLACTALLTAYFYRHASDAADLSAVLDRKHTLNICQTYTFGYQQRYSDFTKSPWTDCQELMTRVYGKPEPSLKEAVIKNPPAMIEHFLWNLSLVPSGLQVLLMNVSSGSVDPDYAPVQRSWLALPCSLILLAIVFAGGVQLIRNRRYWWEEWLKYRVWGWVLLMSVGLVTVGIMIAERPRPSYMFSLGILLRALIGMFIVTMIGGQSERRWRSAIFPVVAVLAVAVIPSYYDLVSTLRGPQPRPLVENYERLATYSELLQQPGAVLVSPGYGGELCNYIARGACQGLNYFDLRSQVSSSTTWVQKLESSGATVFYADEAVLDDPAGQRFVQQTTSAGWQTLGFDNVDGQRWILLGKLGVGDSANAAVAPAVGRAFQVGDVPVLGDWNGDGTTKIGLFRKGTWYLDLDGTHQLTSAKAIGWGQEGDIPVVGDWNGDGRTKIGVFRKGIWYLDIDGSHRLTPTKMIKWGQAGDIPVLGHWNKGKSTAIGVFRSNTWLLDTTGSHKEGPVDQFTVEVK